MFLVILRGGIIFFFGVSFIYLKGFLSFFIIIIYGWSIPLGGLLKLVIKYV